jgi:hypothetical protein
LDLVVPVERVQEARYALDRVESLEVDVESREHAGPTELEGNVVQVRVAASEEPLTVDVNDACQPRWGCNPPFRGGLRIENRDRNNAGCTAGFIAENPAGLYYTMTSGHCGRGTYTHVTETLGRRTVGGAPASGVWTPSGVDGANRPTGVNARVDAARIWIPDTAFWRQGRNVYIRGNLDYMSVVNVWTEPLTLPLGLTVRRAGGGNSNFSSAGIVEVVARTWTQAGVTYREKMMTSYSSNGGDSGSPIVVEHANRGLPNYTGVAIHDGRSSVDGVSLGRGSHIGYVELLLEVRLRHANRL